MKTKSIAALTIITFILFSACNIYNPAEPVPSYIHIDNIKVSISDTTVGLTGQGSKSSKITDAWIYIDEQLIGCFEMPCTVPVLWEGTHNLKIRAGIKVNGIAATRAPYPFYDFYLQPISLQRGAITTITGATVKYLNNISFKWKVDFEGIGPFSLDTNSHVSETQLNCITTPPANPIDVFEGKGSAVAYLRSSNYVFECFSDQKFSLGNSDAFLEFNYKSNHTFTVSLIGDYMINNISYGNEGPIEALTFNPSPNWNKAYVYITPAIKQLMADINANHFRVFFQMRNTYYEDSIGFALDNIKLIQ